jgi:hypothetical protein
MENTYPGARIIRPGILNCGCCSGEKLFVLCQRIINRDESKAAAKLPVRCGAQRTVLRAGESRMGAPIWC